VFTVTVARPDVTTDEVADVLRKGLGSRYRVLPGMGVTPHPVGEPHPSQPDRIAVGVGSGRLFHAQVTISRPDGQTLLHVSPGGALPTLRLINRVSVVRKVVHVLRAASDLH
jgi:hypothetical protein